MQVDDQTAALLAILELDEIDIREGRFRDADEVLAELESDDEESDGE